MVITCASHAQGPRFEPGRNQLYAASWIARKFGKRNCNPLDLRGTCQTKSFRPCGAMVARLTPDQKVACSTHVGVSAFRRRASRTLYRAINLRLQMPLHGCIHFCRILAENRKHRFRSVVVITCALHAQGPRFEPGRNQLLTLQITQVQ